jgi:hypothetical protein
MVYKITPCLTQVRKQKRVWVSTTWCVLKKKRRVVSINLSIIYGVGHLINEIYKHFWDI